MQLYGPSGKPIPQLPQTGWKRFCPCLSKVWSRIPLLVKFTMGVLALITGIFTVAVHGHTIWRWIIPADLAVQPVKVINAEYAKPDLILGTTFTKSKLKDDFPFCYVVFHMQEGINLERDAWDFTASDSTFQTAADWKNVKIVPDFAKRTVAWWIPSVNAIQKSKNFRIVNGTFSATVPMLVGKIYAGPFIYEGQPSMYLETLSDNQAFPVFVLGFRIPPARLEPGKSK